MLCFSAVLCLPEKEALDMRVCVVPFVSGPQKLLPVEGSGHHDNINSDN